MASIQKKKNSKGGFQYYVSYELPKYIDGKRRKTTKTFPVGTTLSEVKQFVAEKELEKNRGALVSTNLDLTFEELGDIYFSTYTQTLSPTTKFGYEGIYRNSKPYGLKNYFGKSKVRNIRSRDVQAYINFLSLHVSAKTVKNFFGLLRILFDLAVQEGIIQREANPMLNKINRPKQEKKPVEAYTLEEVKLILKLAEEDSNPNIHLLINLLLFSGLRRGEACFLQYKDINFKEKYIYIHKSRVVVNHEEFIKSVKSSAGVRKVYIPDRLVNILKEYRQKYLENKLKYGKDFKDTDYVLCRCNGKPYSPQGISNMYLRFLDRNKEKIRYLKFHGLRHTYASLLIEQGENPKTVQHNLGHSDVSLTLQIYSHSYESAQKRAAENLENTIKQIV